MLKDKFRLSQIEAEGNDPQETGKSYGTPHDLASLYGLGRDQSDPSNIPSGYNEKKPLGRPKKKHSKSHTQNSAFGKDPLGRDGMKKDYNDNGKLKPTFNGGSPLAMEHKNMLKKVPRPPKTKKQLVFEENKKGDQLLDENNLK